MENILHGGFELNLPHNEFTKDLPADMLAHMPAVERSEDDKELYVEFLQMPQLMKAKSELAQRPIFENVDVVRITTPTKEVFGASLPLTPEGYDSPTRILYTRRFPEHWKFYLEMKEKKIGTPLSNIMNDPARIATLNAVGVHTLEQLASLDARHIGESWIDVAKAQAREHIEQSQLSSQLEERNAALKTELEAQRDELEALRALAATVQTTEEAQEAVEQLAERSKDRAGGRKSGKA